MKIPILPRGAAFLAVLLAGLASCDSDSDPASGALPAASFSSSDFSFSEADGEQVVTLVLDKPTLTDRDIVVQVHCGGGAPISAEPAISGGTITAHLLAGTSSISIKVLPINNGKMDGTRKVDLSILPMDESYRVGNLSDALLTIADDESPSRVVFAERASSLGEGEADGFVLNIQLSSAAPAAGIVILETETDAIYSSDFITMPSVVNGKIYLPVAEGQTSVSVNVFASNDNEKQPDRHILFRFADASGGVMQDGSDGTFQLNIVEDDSNPALIPMLPIKRGEVRRED